MGKNAMVVVFLVPPRDETLTLISEAIESRGELSTCACLIFADPRMLFAGVHPCPKILQGRVGRVCNYKPLLDSQSPKRSSWKGTGGSELRREPFTTLGPVADMEACRLQNANTDGKIPKWEAKGGPIE
ncbi:uncharacterized protein ACLA_048450 [Aspergillus clavatus NRRL 1]|uniref:Uncharacterized protein n=1 Tax=Aspergillus clavatus (strain ATCC 1007 / CBS 513.65 / DSM 816 / NCTC 3887 / NRRL 1 / QM 1276 / 107) TaxID=344612 RepID=A1CHM0_ASPCL|nr:uncharacterized protein ACLA_048450 [Aspergillus clavatus NRRL 1]EAW10375.1 hypothetical protein ACLA_048450 [Aspergillus clavatus NRRL 1]